MQNSNLSSSNLNSHMVKLFFTAQNILKSKIKAENLQVICRTIENGENKIVGKTEVLKVVGNPYHTFLLPVETEFVFKKKQILILDLIYD